MKLREFFFGLFVGMAIISLMAWGAKPKEAEAMIVSPANGDYVAYTQAIERKYQINPNLLVAICAKESHWKNVKGKRGEIGVCQVKPESAEHALGKAPSRPLLVRGSIGDSVKFAQALLKIRVDGVYGTATEIQVKMFQYHNRILVDGIIGPQTWAILAGPITYTHLLWDQRTNIEIAAKYLVWLRELLETDDAAILMAAYNGGPGHPVVKYMVSVDQYRQSLMPGVEVP